MERFATEAIFPDPQEITTLGRDFLLSLGRKEQQKPGGKVLWRLAEANRRSLHYAPRLGSMLLRRMRGGRTCR
jgi:hypothetical protein